MLDSVRSQSTPAYSRAFCLPPASSCREHPVDGTPDGSGATIEDMRVDHRRGDIAVSEQLLYGADVITVLQEVRGERTPEGVAGRPFANAG